MPFSSKDKSPRRKAEINKVNRGHSKNRTSDKKVLDGKIIKRTKTNSNNTQWGTLDGWICKNKVKPTENSVTENASSQISQNKKEVLLESPNNKKSPVKKNKETFKRHSSGSFAKYGLCLPSVDDILIYQKKIEDQKQQLDSIIMSEDSQESLEFSIDEPEIPILDCKHLDENDINEAYKCNSQYVHDIFHGIQYCARHERFKKQNYKDNFTAKDLKFNTSMISFTHQQLRQLLRQLHKEFDNEEGLPPNNQYFMKVLLPELCLKIFMDVHNMNCAEATTYLDNKPVVVD